MDEASDKRAKSDLNLTVYDEADLFLERNCLLKDTLARVSSFIFVFDIFEYEHLLETGVGEGDRVLRRPEWSHSAK